MSNNSEQFGSIGDCDGLDAPGTIAMNGAGAGPNAMTTLPRQIRCSSPNTGMVIPETDEENDRGGDCYVAAG